MDKLVPRKDVLKTLSVHYHTLNAMADRGDIEMVRIGRKRFFNLEKYLRDKGIHNKTNKKQICYCRVSSSKQKEDLDRQIIQMKLVYPTYEIISDIGSGLNFDRTGLNKIIEYAINGEIEVLVVAYKDRLARFGYELIEKLITNYSHGRIIILNQKEEETPEEEITKDLMSIMNVYVAKINGLRKYKPKMKDMIKNSKNGDKV